MKEHIECLVSAMEFVEASDADPGKKIFSDIAPGKGWFKARGGIIRFGTDGFVRFRLVVVAKSSTLI